MPCKVFPTINPNVTVLMACKGLRFHDNLKKKQRVSRWSGTAQTFVRSFIRRERFRDGCCSGTLAFVCINCFTNKLPSDMMGALSGLPRGVPLLAPCLAPFSSGTSPPCWLWISGTFPDAYLVVPSLNYKFSDGPACNYLAPWPWICVHRTIS